MRWRAFGNSSGIYSVNLLRRRKRDFPPASRRCRKRTAKVQATPAFHLWPLEARLCGGLSVAAAAAHQRRHAIALSLARRPKEAIPVKDFAPNMETNALRGHGENEPALEPFDLAQTVRNFAKTTPVESFARDMPLPALRYKGQRPHPSPHKAPSTTGWPRGRQAP